MFMDRRITFVYFQPTYNDFFEVTGEEESSRKTVWANRQDDRLVESTSVDRGTVLSRNEIRRSYVIRPYDYLRRFGLNLIPGTIGGFSRLRLVSEDGIVFFVRGFSEEGRNRFYVVECQFIGLN